MLFYNLIACSRVVAFLMKKSIFTKGLRACNALVVLEFTLHVIFLQLHDILDKNMTALFCGMPMIKKLILVSFNSILFTKLMFHLGPSISGIFNPIWIENSISPKIFFLDLLILFQQSLHSKIQAYPTT